MSGIIHPSSSIIHRRRGIALLVVLMIVMAITIISAGFIARTDLQLACGVNADMRTQMDQLADSALEHARGLILQPQDIDIGSATGWTWNAANQQLLPESPDYYDVSLTRDATDYRTYSVACEAYRLKNEQKVGRVGLAATLRLDPCIGLWSRTDFTLRQAWVLYGDACTQGCLTNQAATAALQGDVFATGLVGTPAVGRTYGLADLPLEWPAVATAGLTAKYSTDNIMVAALSNQTYGPHTPAHIFRRSGNLVLNSGVHTTGMLLVEGNLDIVGNGNVIAAARNLPALYVTGDLAIGPVTDLKIEGLVLVGGNIRISAAAAGVEILGGLFVNGLVSETTPDASSGGNTGVTCGNPRWGRGKYSGALQLDGADDCVRTPDSTTQLQLTNDYTLSVWVKAASAQKSGAGVVTKCSLDGSVTHWGLQFDPAASTTFVVRHLNNLWATGITLNDATPTWRHIAVVRSGNTMTSYFEGIQSSSGAWAVPPGSGNGHLNLGADGTGSPDHVYEGWLDDVRVYSRALTGAEIGQIRSAGSVADLMAQWLLDGPGSKVTIWAEPVRGAIVTWPNGINNEPEYWSPAAGAFFRDVLRQQP